MEYILGLVLVFVFFAGVVFYFKIKSELDKKTEEFELMHGSLTEASNSLENINNSIDERRVKLDRIESSITRREKDIEEFKQVSAEKKLEIESDISSAEESLESIESKLSESERNLHKLNAETKSLQLLKKNADRIKNKLAKGMDDLDEVTRLVEQKRVSLIEFDNELASLKGEIDLYSRIDDFVSQGFFETPAYLYDTSARFSEEIRLIRKGQKDLISSKGSMKYPDGISISGNKSLDKKILDGQVRIMLRAFNIECDTLIGKVGPSNFSRTLERIEKVANSIEKSSASLRCGFNIEYVRLKFEECKLQYQYTLKKQEEQEEQRLIREQIREEQKLIKEYEKALLQAEKEEKMYRELLDKAREELADTSDQDRIVAENRIAELEQQLLEAEAKEERAKSMAEQTRKGHVYVISNIGSFGEEVYKIGLTRRLDPMDRVKELGDASVPFAFDVHAMIYVDDAPALETALHREFTAMRVNAVNLRKEFFRIDLNAIREAVERISGQDAEFKTTALAEEYYESRRLQGVDVTAA